MSETVERCTICNRPRDDHNARHLFNPPGKHVDASQFAPKKPTQGVQGDDVSRRIPGAYSVTQTPFDPVLRQALITKGVISVQDLADADKMINALTNQMRGVQ